MKPIGNSKDRKKPCRVFFTSVRLLKPDKTKNIFNRRKKTFSRRVLAIVRSCFFGVLHIQQERFLLSGFRPHTPKKVRTSNESICIIYYVSSSYRTTYFYLVRSKSLQEQNRIVRFHKEKNLTVKRCFFGFLLSGFGLFFHFSRYLLLSGIKHISAIVRFLQVRHMTLKYCIVRFCKEKNLTIGGSC